MNIIIFFFSFLLDLTKYGGMFHETAIILISSAFQPNQYSLYLLFKGLFRFLWSLFAISEFIFAARFSDWRLTHTDLYFYVVFDKAETRYFDSVSF